MTYKIMDVIDFDERYTYEYPSAAEAINAYNEFVDHGNAKNNRTVALIDGDGEVVTKKEFRA